MSSGQNTWSDVFDHEAALTMADGDPSGLAELVELLEVHFPPVMEDLAEAVEQGDADGIRQFAHRIKGSVGTFHARSAHEVAYQLERAGADNHIEESRRLFPRLTQEVDVLILNLHAFLSELESE